MDGWDPRKHRASLIRFDGRAWRIASLTPGPNGANQYELVPWEPGPHELIGIEIDYNAEYVARRDRTAVSYRKRSRVTLALRVVSPLIGFLPAQTKAQLEAAYGVDPVATTFQSVFLEFLTAVCCLAMAAIGIAALAGTFVYRLAGGTGVLMVTFMVIAVVAGIDGSVRYGRILAEERPPPGFYEWALTKRRGVN